MIVGCPYVLNRHSVITKYYLATPIHMVATSDNVGLASAKRTPKCIDRYANPAAGIKASMPTC